MVDPEDRLKKMSAEDKERMLLSIFRNPNFESYFQWLDMQEVVNSSLSDMKEQMEDNKKAKDMDEFFKNLKTLSEAGKKSLDLQKTLDEMRKSFDKDELLRETERRLGAKRGSIEEYAKVKKEISRRTIQGVQ